MCYLSCSNCLCTISLFEEGGDWERKNRLKVYEGLYYMSTRNFKKAADLFLDSISTFTTYELFPYDTFIFYTVLASIISLDRVSLKQKVSTTTSFWFCMFLVMTANRYYIFHRSYLLLIDAIFVTGSRCSRNINHDWKDSTTFRVSELSV